MPTRSARKRKPTFSDGLVVDGVLDVDEVAEVIPFNYAITAYGSDPPVDSLIKRLREGDIFIPLFSLSKRMAGGAPRFQREYIWKKIQADRFIESLLLGLPVPGIFLVKEESGRHLVLDGHQRLRTLYRYYTNDWEGETYSLEGVQERFRNRTYQELEPADRRRLDDAVIHATIIRQDEPTDDLSSIYLVFERLNSGGTSLQPQEIRVALYQGNFVQLLTALNTDARWRALFGRRSRRLKDMELILRFFALLETSKHYSRPMKEFLSGYMAHRRNIPVQLQQNFRGLFEATCDSILRGIGPSAFKPKGTVNAALVDSLMVGIARRITAKGPISNFHSLQTSYRKLLRREDFQAVIARATADEESVKLRIKLATRAFASAG